MAKIAKYFLQRFFHNSSFWDLYLGFLANSAAAGEGEGEGGLNNFRNFSFDTSTVKLCTHLCFNIFLQCVPSVHFLHISLHNLFSVQKVWHSRCVALLSIFTSDAQSLHGKGNGRGRRGKGEKNLKVRDQFSKCSIIGTVSRDGFRTFLFLFLLDHAHAAYFYFLGASLILCWSKHISAGKIIK
jgi:hypothetical protein